MSFCAVDIAAAAANFFGHASPFVIFYSVLFYFLVFIFYDKNIPSTKRTHAHTHTHTSRIRTRMQKNNKRVMDYKRKSASFIRNSDCKYFNYNIYYIATTSIHLHFIWFFCELVETTILVAKWPGLCKIMPNKLLVRLLGFLFLSWYFLDIAFAAATAATVC